MSEREIAADYGTIEALHAYPEIARFLRWIAGKDPDFHKTTRTARRRLR